MLKRITQSQNLYKYLTAVILLIIPLYPKFPFLKIPGAQVSARVEDFLLALAALFLTVKILPQVKKVFSMSIESAIAIYILIGLISLLSAIFLTRTVVPHIGFLHWTRRVEYIIPFFLGVLAIKKKENLNFYLNILIVVSFIVFIYAIGQRYFYWPIIVTQNLEYAKGIALRYVAGGHINSTFAGHYDLATFLVLILPIFISLFFIIKRLKVRIILGIMILSGLWLLIASVSRISIASYLFGSTIALLILKKYKEIIIIFLVSLILFSFSQDLRVRYLRIFDEAKRRLGEISVTVYAQETYPERRTDFATPTPTPHPILEDRSSSIRLNVEWPRAIRAFTKNPLLGTGYSSITLATDNDYL